VEVYVKADEIENVRSLDRAFGLVFGLITGTAVFGFTASTASNALAGVRRKSRSIGIMRLMGFRRTGIVLFPVAQTVATGFFGSILASFLYLGVAAGIDRLFSSSLPERETVCSLPASFLTAIFGVVLLLSALSALFAAWQAAAREPSEVIRDV
jgi:putative ABC transport system permease protein